jgi:peptide/nickel transport system permease protein
MVGLVLVLVLVALSVSAPFLTRADPLDMDYSSMLKAPSPQHLFGTDNMGRDVLSQVLYGGRVSILLGVGVALATALAGVGIGVISGYYPRLDNPVMRAMDILMAFPPILLALAIVAVLGPQLVNVFIALTITYAPRSARVVRGTILQLKQKEYVDAARSIGAGNLRIISKHLMPNSMAPLLVQQTYVLALAILAEASLSFLGVGAPPTVSTLGGVISDGRSYLRTAPWQSLYPGVAIAALVLGFNLLGDGLRDVLDPHMKR